MTDTAPKTDVVTITVNDQEIACRPGELVIAAAERAGTYIPRFCYHPRMRPVGMCRMCIVEIDTGRGPALQPACMIPVADGMKVDTQSDVTKKAQDGVLEFLLINHPLDCPVCDKGGECPLQDQTMAYGPGESRFVEEKRHKEKPIPISDLVYLDRERCILCDRCTRFAKDVAGDPLIHFINRGNNTEINTFPDEPFSSYFSGNTVQICPVGALTAKPYRFKARPWDLEQTESTCTSCSVGCRVAVQSSRNQVLRYVGVDIDPVNWGWLCDKGRFDFEAVDSDERIQDPLLRKGDEFVAVRWAEALRGAADALKAAVDAKGPESIAVLGGARLTNEDAYAWAKLAKGTLGTDNVDCQLADGLPADVVLGLPAATIDDVCRPGGTVILAGPDLKEELPVLFLRLRHAVEYDGVKVIELAPQRTGFSSLATVSLFHRPGEVAEAARALLDGIPPGKDGGGVDPAVLDAAHAVLRAHAEPVKIVIGRQSIAESDTFAADAAASLLRGLPKSTFLPAVRRANVRGALDMGLTPGFLPGRVTLDDGRSWFAKHWPTTPTARGLDATGILTAAAAGSIEVLVLLGADPLADFPDRDLAARALAAVPTVISLDQFLTESTMQADVVLPAAGFAETGGTTTNLEGRVSHLGQIVTPPGTAHTDWMIAAELAYQLGSDLQLESVEQIWHEITTLAPAYADIPLGEMTGPISGDGVLLPMPTTRNGSAPAAPADADADAAEAEADAADAPTDGDAGAGDDDDTLPAPAPSDKPTVFVFEPGDALEPAPLDAYGLRLIASRKLYDQGTLVTHSPSLAKLAPGTVLRVNPYDFDRLGVSIGHQVRVKTPKGQLMAEIAVDPDVPRGSASVFVNQPGIAITSLIDATERVTDLRVDSGGDA
jgi:NADH-quinone oxidoreductase subunit G